MTTPKTIFALILSLMLVGQAVLASTEEIGDPIVKMNSSYDIELDLAVVVQDMLPRLLDAAAEGDPEDAEMLAFIIDAVGIEALQRFTMKGKDSKDHAIAEFQLTLDPQHSESLLYRLLTTPNKSCDFARYVSQDDVVIFVTMHNLPHYLDVFLDFLAQPEMAELMGDVPTNEAGDIALGEFAPRTDLLPLLSGELDFFMLDSPTDEPVNPMAAPYFLVLGSTDGFALREKILYILGMTGGESGSEITVMLDSIEPEMIGGFEMKVMPFGGAVAVSQDYLVIGMAPDVMREMLYEAKGDLKVPDGIEWAYIDGPKYGVFMESIMGMAAMMSGEDSGEEEWMMEIYNVLFQHIHSEEILYRSTKNGMEGQIDVNGPVLTGLYKMLPTLLDKLPEMMAAEEEDEEKDAYKGAIMVLDEAMTAYAYDHGNTYPEDPVQLLDEGYLEDWPFGAATPAGEYMDWGYTYHPYYDENGAVNGYIFFLYGMGEETGYDVYSAENVATEGPFRLERDGVPDGIVSFCYDGVATEEVGTFFAN